MNFHSCIGYRHTLLSRSRGYFVSQRAKSTYPVGKEQRRPILLLNLWHCLQLQQVYNVESNTLCHTQRMKDPVMQCHLLMPSSRLFVNSGFSVTHTIVLRPMTPHSNTQHILLSLFIRTHKHTDTHTYTHPHIHTRTHIRTYTHIHTHTHNTVRYAKSRTCSTFF